MLNPKAQASWPGLDATLRTQLTTRALLRNEKYPYSMGAYGREEAMGDYREDRQFGGSHPVNETM